jgi:hypothetical protein
MPQLKFETCTLRIQLATYCENRKELINILCEWNVQWQNIEGRLQIRPTHLFRGATTCYAQMERTSRKEFTIEIGFASRDITLNKKIFGPWRILPHHRSLFLGLLNDAFQFNVLLLTLAILNDCFFYYILKFNGVEWWNDCKWWIVKGRRWKWSWPG